MVTKYAIYGHYFIKSDINSFSVFALEILSGKRNIFEDLKSHVRMN
jgi:hypothetical protein